MDWKAKAILLELQVGSQVIILDKSPFSAPRFEGISSYRHQVSYLAKIVGSFPIIRGQNSSDKIWLASTICSDTFSTKIGMLPNPELKKSEVSLILKTNSFHVCASSRDLTCQCSLPEKALACPCMKIFSFTENHKKLFKNATNGHHSCRILSLKYMQVYSHASI